MSDYEADDWSQVNLPGPQYSIGSSSPPESFTDHVVPKGQSLADLRTKPDKEKKKTLGPRLAKSFHPILQSIRPQTHHGARNRPIQQPVAIKSQRTRLESYKSHQERPDQPDSVYELMVTWKSFINNQPELDVTKEETAQNRLDSICVASDAFIKPLFDDQDRDTNKLQIWGTPEQCKEARLRLESWEMDARNPVTKKHNTGWDKINAYDGRSEHRLMHHIMRENAVQNMQSAGNIAFDYEAYLSWPTGYNLDAYLKQYESKILVDISRTFCCRFYHERNGRERYTKIQATSQSDCLAVYQRLVNLAIEMVAQRNLGTHGNFFRVPSIEAYRDRIVYEKDVETSNFSISLSGDPPNDEDTDKWADLARVLERRNRKEIKAALESFFRIYQVTRSHVRLRAEFGELGLVKFMKPSDGSTSFLTDEFLEMIQNPRTEFSDCTLQAKGRDMFQLVDVITGMEEFTNPVDAYKMLFDFQSSNSSNQLRLETELEPGFDVGEPEISAQRWFLLKSQTNASNVVGLKLLDLERPSCMLRVDSFELYMNDTATKEMHNFQTRLKLRPAPEGLKATPRCRIMFPPGKKDLVYVTEITAKRFQFKDTSGTFELRREDMYDQRSGRESSGPISSKWIASFFYFEWDNLMGEFANAEPGEKVGWNRKFTTFFPERVDPEHPRALPEGFKTFMAEVREIQELLGKAISQLPKQEKSIQNGNIVKGRISRSPRGQSTRRA